MNHFAKIPFKCIDTRKIYKDRKKLLIRIWKSVVIHNTECIINSLHNSNIYNEPVQLSIANARSVLSKHDRGEF